MSIISTGQFTLIDQNDAAPITAFVAASASPQQVYTKDDDTAAVYTPNWVSTPLVLSAKVYVGKAGSSNEISALLTNRKWSTTFDGTSLGTAVTYSVNTNLDPATTPSQTYYFQGDYTDPTSGLVTRVAAQITLNVVKTGTNAVYLQVNGRPVIEQATGTTKSAIRLYADLIRSSGIDNTGVTYRWSTYPFALADVIDGNYASVTTKYGFNTTAQVTANLAAALQTTGAIGQYNGAGITTTNLPDATNIGATDTTGGWNDTKGIVISETAIVDLLQFKVEAKDADNKTYVQYFVVYDVSDPYETRILSSQGDKLVNGVGSTNIYPEVYYGATKVADYQGYKFRFGLFDGKQNKQAGFIDTTKTAVAGGRNITANTTGASATFTYDGAAITFAAGDVIKAVKPDGTANFYEVASSTGNTVTIRTTGLTNTWLAGPLYAAPSTTNDHVGGKFFACTANPGGTFNGVAVTGQAGYRIATIPTGSPVSSTSAYAVTVTGDEIDVKGVITIEADRP